MLKYRCIIACNLLIIIVLHTSAGMHQPDLSSPVSAGGEDGPSVLIQDPAAEEITQPTLREVLESMKPPALLDEDGEDGSADVVSVPVWRGPSDEQLVSGEEGAASDSEQPDLTGSQPDLTGSQPDLTGSQPDLTGSQHPQTDTDSQQNRTAEPIVVEGEAADGQANGSRSQSCVCREERNVTESPPEGAESLTVQLLNATALSELLTPESGVKSRSQPAPCVLVLFYGGTCPFSAAAAPHFNAMPRAFPSLHLVAIDALESNSLNTRFGIIAVPTFFLFHNGRPHARFNQSEPTLQLLAEFVSAHTQLAPAVTLNVTSADFIGPVPSVARQQTDWCLVAAWVFLAACALYAATRLHMWRHVAETLRNWWIEAEQHLHED